jgi:6-pyruvoyltetrahydropterin/6-carboxytetrahydropterin synthase
MTHRITRSHEICAGHRVFGHEGKCAHLHGHGYVFDFTCESVGLDKVGRVTDFSVVKSTLCEWLEARWDHRMLIWEGDPILNPLRDLESSVVSVPFNPTAENMALHLVEVVGPALLPRGVRLVKCVVHETGKCSAEWEDSP